MFEIDPAKPDCYRFLLQVNIAAKLAGYRYAGLSWLISFVQSWLLSASQSARDYQRFSMSNSPCCYLPYFLLMMVNKSNEMNRKQMRPIEVEVRFFGFNHLLLLFLFSRVDFFFLSLSLYIAVFAFGVYVCVLYNIIM